MFCISDENERICDLVMDWGVDDDLWEEDDSYPYNLHKLNETRYRVKKLTSKKGKKIEEVKGINEQAKVGETIKCPICGRLFKKKSYQQKFCSISCKDKYHNKRMRYK